MDGWIYEHVSMWCTDNMRRKGRAGGGGQSQDRDRQTIRQKLVQQLLGRLTCTEILHVNRVQ